MKISLSEKGPQKRANESGTVTPKVARMILSGFATSIVTSRDRMWIDTPEGYPRIVLVPEILKRASRYKLSEVIGARNILIALNVEYGPTNSTYSTYLQTVYPEYDILKSESSRATGKDVLLLREATSGFLPQMGLELRIDYGGVAIVEST